MHSKLENVCRYIRIDVSPPAMSTYSIYTYSVYVVVLTILTAADISACIISTRWDAVGVYTSSMLLLACNNLC